MIDRLFVEQRNVVWPEGVVGPGSLVKQNCDRRRNSHRFQVSGLRCDAHKSILRKWAWRSAFRPYLPTTIDVLVSGT